MPRDHRNPRLDDSRFLAGNRLERRAQVRLVIEIDRRDHRHGGRDDVGGVVSAAQAHLDHRDVDGRVAEDLECRRRGDFEVYVGW